MAIVDLTCKYDSTWQPTLITPVHMSMNCQGQSYTGVVYKLEVDSMHGTYIDFPGHLRETDDGQRADNVDLCRFYRMPAAVIRLDRASGSGAVTAADLRAAAGEALKQPARALIINALGQRNPREIENRSVWLGADAVEFIIATGVELLVSDIYEAPVLEGVFNRLFSAGISTVCIPWNLAQLRAARAELTVSFPKIPDATQLSCTLLAEF